MTPDGTRGSVLCRFPLLAEKKTNTTDVFVFSYFEKGGEKDGEWSKSKEWSMWVICTYRELVWKRFTGRGRQRHCVLAVLFIELIKKKLTKTKTKNMIN